MKNKKLDIIIKWLKFKLIKDIKQFFEFDNFYK